MSIFSFRKKVLFFIGGLFFTISSLHATSFKLIPSLSKLTWKASKVLGGHTGHVNFKEGSLELKEGRLTGGHFKVDMKSIVDLDLDPLGRWNKILVEHLKSQDFFSVEKHPYSEFILQESKKISGNEYIIKGSLVIKGIKKTLDFKALVRLEGDVLKASGNIVFDRTLFDIKFRSGKFFKGLGDKLIHDTVTLKIELVAKKEGKKI
jgi:polyisoprenoid-binding protein YceI